MKNLQAPWARVISQGDALFLHSIFDTIQGEGPFAGFPAVFVRLAGCNLQCPLCDTEYTEGSALTKVEDITNRVKAVAANIRLVVLTGGEPLRQNCAPLIHSLIMAGFRVQIETNGMLKMQDDDVIIEHIMGDNCDIVVSPKTATLNDQVASYARAYKYVVQHGAVDKDDQLPRSALEHPLPLGGRIARPPAEWEGDVYIQPADEQDDYKNQLNLETAVASVRFKAPDELYDRRLCIQMHKIARLP